MGNGSVGPPGTRALDMDGRKAFIWPMHENREAALKRLKRLEGQVRGVARMVEEDRYCVDILTQIAAVRAALKGVEKLVIEDHASHCIEDALASGDRTDQRAKFMELIQLLDRARD
ncbi:metal-sensitive transcriptional regulator [Jannaschia sp. KMU-145]|uniref:metal-sensitive transcriptional regulator n=2 Tax=Jannaschia TaxID=188905 RepID=UPI00396B4555